MANRFVRVIRRLVAGVVIIAGAFLVLGFFMGVASLVVDSSRRGLVELSLVVFLLAMGLAMMIGGYKCLPGP